MTVPFKKILATPLILMALLAPIGAGCSPEGAGSIKIENPEAVRSKVAGPTESTGKETAKQAKAKAIEEEAGKKNPKLR